MVTAGVRPRGGQPQWGRGAPEACAAALQCSPPWPVCSPLRCRLRCRGETRVKYSQGRPFCPSALVCTFLTRSGQLAPSRVFRSRPNLCFHPFMLTLIPLVLRLVRWDLWVSPDGDLSAAPLPQVLFLDLSFRFPCLISPQVLLIACLCSRQKEW